VKATSATAPASWPNSDGGDDTAVTGDYVTYANDYDEAATGTAPSVPHTGFFGMNAWIKSGYASDDNQKFLLGNERDTSNQIDLTVHPEHKSYSEDFSGAVMTEHKLRQRLRRFHAAKTKYGYYIDHLIASEGVWMAYEATRIGREYIDRTGRIASIKSQGMDSDRNFGGFGFTIDGRSYTGYTSTYIEDGTMYGMRKGGNNYKRYVPPDGSGMRNFDRAQPFIPFRFVAGALTGLGTTKMPIYDTQSGGGISRVTEGCQFPGWLRMQLVPDQPCGMKIINVGTDKVYSSDADLSGAF
jgi:hypothetical protein